MITYYFYQFQFDVLKELICVICLSSGHYLNLTHQCNSNYFPDNLSITDMVFWFDNNAKKLLDVIKKTKNHEQKQMFIQHLTSTLYNNKILNNPYHLEPQKISNEQIALPIINILYDNSDVFHKESILFFFTIIYKKYRTFRYK